MNAPVRRAIEDLARERDRSARPYLEFLRVPSMSAGIYELAAGAEDNQRPHEQDEIYYVVSGRARFKAAGESSSVKPGSVLFVPARVEHRFERIEEDLRVLVVFAPEET
ncbi:MAG TPA: cupin domain-containing protein [Candidatus Polarisedimenticolia bacterium]|jgi:mannose-6-phosphate isomerase-like protein (cupin superfamily)